MNQSKVWLRIATASIGVTLALAAGVPAVAGSASTVTPIRHLIIVVGENHTFDNTFGTYRPKAGQKIDNLLSKGIVNSDGTQGPNFDRAAQQIGFDTGTYSPVTPSIGSYSTLPQPYTTYAGLVTPGVLDSRFPADLPNGPYQISKFVTNAAYTGDPVHRFFQMWQDVDGGRKDKFVWVEETIGTGSNGNPAPAGGFNPKEGAISMGFFNMNPYIDASGNAQSGDEPILKSLADNYALSDNYHQAIMGGTGANFMALVTGHAAYFTDAVSLDGSPAVPFANQIENPNPIARTNNYYTQDGYGGGSYVNCADLGQPGVGPVANELRTHGIFERNCAASHYYLVNNYNMYWNRPAGTTRPLGPTSFTLPPQAGPTIADVMTTHNVSWKYYSADSGSDPANFPTDVDGVPIPFHSYCGICDPLSGFEQIMTNPSELAKLQDYTAFLADVKAGTLPAVSFVRPFEALAGHPADSNPALYELFLADLIAKVQANPELWATSAIVVTTDEGGGYYDSGYIQLLDFLGDGTRIPMLVVSPWAKKGVVDHTYQDHVSILKFIERNWRLPKISARSRDNLPNPITRDDSYRPVNGPSIGDLTTMFDFGNRHN